MRKTRIGAFVASTALASATILGGAGIASAQDGDSDTIQAGAAKVTATANENCEITFEFGGDASADELKKWNWVADYRVGDEAASIPAEAETDELTEALSVFNPVVASNQDAADALTNHDDYDYDVGFFSNTVNLNDVVEANENGEHTVSFKFYRGAKPEGGWDADVNQGEVVVTGCDDSTGSLGGALGSLDVFGSLGSMS